MLSRLGKGIVGKGSSMRKISGLQELCVAPCGYGMRSMLERGGRGLGATGKCWRGSMGPVRTSGLDLGTPGSQARISSQEVTGWHFFTIVSAGRKKKHVQTSWTKIWSLVS